MGACDAPAAAWQVGWVRGHPSLESRALGSDNVAYFLNNGQVIGNSSCHSAPLIRTCSNGIKPQPKGGNPLGCGFSFDAEGGLIRALTCGSGAATCVGSDAHGVALVVRHALQPSVELPLLRLPAARVEPQPLAARLAVRALEHRRRRAQEALRDHLLRLDVRRARARRRQHMGVPPAVAAAAVAHA